MEPHIKTPEDVIREIGQDLRSKANRETPKAVPDGRESVDAFMLGTPFYAMYVLGRILSLVAPLDDAERLLLVQRACTILELYSNPTKTPT